MAFIDDHGPLDEQYFNVHHSVGSRAANYWTDIMLVQYFIHKIYSWGQMSADPIFSIPTGYDEAALPDPNKDFKDLRKTAIWIERFQTDVGYFAGHPIAIDGRVSRGKSFNNSTMNLTIHHMNYYYRRFVDVWDPGGWGGRTFCYMTPFCLSCVGRKSVQALFINHV